MRGTTSATNPKTVLGSKTASTNDALVAPEKPTAALSEANPLNALTPPPTLRTVAPVATSATKDRLATTESAKLLLAARTPERSSETAVISVNVPTDSLHQTPATSATLASLLVPAASLTTQHSILAVLTTSALLVST